MSREENPGLIAVGLAALSLVFTLFQLFALGFAWFGCIGGCADESVPGLVTLLGFAAANGLFIYLAISEFPLAGDLAKATTAVFLLPGIVVTFFSLLLFLVALLT